MALGPQGKELSGYILLSEGRGARGCHHAHSPTRGTPQIQLVCGVERANGRLLSVVLWPTDAGGVAMRGFAAGGGAFTEPEAATHACAQKP